MAKLVFDAFMRKKVYTICHYQLLTLQNKAATEDGASSEHKYQYIPRIGMAS